ncbi:MAG: cache domain-containing protein [Candidatus Omnitrophica bacterium]|nr:cache domain-containing protein [Candidatus Omnitrophota bacterium]MDD5487729.1 cache domain-containing protein [Candidatus Omnitrophota bacterium]
MRKYSLQSRLMGSFLVVVLAMGVVITLLGVYVIRKDIIERAQKEVKNGLESARTVYNSRITRTLRMLSLAGDVPSLDVLRKGSGLDYVRVAYTPQDSPSDIVEAAFSGKKAGGSRLMDLGELAKIDDGALERTQIEIRSTPRARPTERKILENVMVIESAVPLFSADGKVERVVYGGRIINRDTELVDQIRDLVFGEKLYRSKPMSTVTVFQRDVRISTNVLDPDGERAVGTRVSEKVYDAVIGQGQTWVDRAFVVADWYLTAYEPIKDIKGTTIGMLYVGLLEAPYLDIEREILLALFIITLVVTGAAVGLSCFLASSISRPLNAILLATSKISAGEFDYRVDEEATRITELNKLAMEFNMMAYMLDERGKNLRISNEQLMVMNKRYLDLVGFVSHELKGILSSIVLNSYNLQNEILGPLNDPQKKALKSMSKNLDYLAETVRNFLNLSRIEKGEMTVRKTQVLFGRDILETSIESFSQVAGEKEMSILVSMASDIELAADPSLMLIVMNNLMSNAVKYGTRGGQIKVNVTKREGEVEVEVYNDGRPIPSVDLDKLFKKFSRLTYAGMEKVKGTGIGLFITKEILQAHDGVIWPEPREKGNSFIFKIRTA